MNIATLKPPTSALDLPDGTGPWQQPSAPPILRRGVCGLAQPCLRRTQHTPNFFFQDATLLLVTSGRLDMHSPTRDIMIETGTSLLLVEPGTWANLQKKPAGPEKRFRSVFLTFSPGLLARFHGDRRSTARHNSEPVRSLPLDGELNSTLRQLCISVSSPDISDERLCYRLLDLLAALAERGVGYAPPRSPGTAGRVRLLLSEAPSYPWTVRETGRALAMSEATLRRRLTQEQMSFNELLIDVRMHHGLMLIQSTDWNIGRIAETCGYLSRARFSERFKKRFGYLPSAVR
ncbi:helix-turn-helix transcriptional regulator [Pseudomonas sp. L13]|uniref:helix-turn-helix transcriptional regulator n=1 Tax=Pseudomonas sp. L13 TaxID=343985 RepID=UPI00137AA190|nr:helix-turn-helix transcriptional regulator [Pseudomonas sp. L13]NCE89692.1 AraC family transcriptional regulator [Pseudomonas sp. L13]